MEFTVEEISPLKKNVAIKIMADEVNKGIEDAAAYIKNSVKLDGFRKGKAPLGVIKKRFHNEIHNDAKEALIRRNIASVIEQMAVEPLNDMKVKGADKDISGDESFEFNIEFETMPEFDLPPYEGLEVEEIRYEMDSARQDAIIKNFLRHYAKQKNAESNDPAADGQIATIDFEFFEDGKPVEGMQAKNYSMEIGGKEALPELEELVKTIPVGHTGEKQISLSTDFPVKDLAGKTVDMKVTVHSVKDLQIPELNDDFAKSIGYKDTEDLVNTIKVNYSRTMKNLSGMHTQEKLLEQMLKTCDFPLPQTVVDMQARLILADYAANLEKSGKNLASLGKKLDELLEDVRPEAEQRARRNILLLEIAKKENLKVEDREVLGEIYQHCQETGEDFNATLEKMDESGFYYTFQEQLLADKAMDFVYDKARITYVNPPADDTTGNGGIEGIAAETGQPASDQDESGKDVLAGAEKTEQ